MAKTKSKSVKKQSTNKSKSKSKIKPTPPAITATKPPVYRSSNTYNNTPQTPGIITLNCPANGCNKAYSYADKQLARKALMRHLFRYKALVEKREEEEEGEEEGGETVEEGSKALKRREYEDAHHDAWMVENKNRRTYEEKQKNARELYKLNNQEKVARASRISNYRAQAKKIPEVASQGWDAIVQWAEEKELLREAKLMVEKQKECATELEQKSAKGSKGGIKGIKGKGKIVKGKGKAIKKGN